MWRANARFCVARRETTVVMIVITFPPTYGGHAAKSKVQRSRSLLPEARLRFFVPLGASAGRIVRETLWNTRRVSFGSLWSKLTHASSLLLYNHSGFTRTFLTCRKREKISRKDLKSFLSPRGDREQRSDIHNTSVGIFYHFRYISGAFCIHNEFSWLVHVRGE